MWVFALYAETLHKSLKVMEPWKNNLLNKIYIYSNATIYLFSDQRGRKVLVLMHF